MDQNSNDTKSPKKRCTGKIAIVFLLVLVLATFLSRTVYSVYLPAVTTYTVEKGVLPYSAESQGTVGYHTWSDVKVFGDFRVIDVFVEQGDTVAEGTALASLDVARQELERKQRELTLAKLDKQISETKNKKEKASLETDRALMQEEFDIFLASYPQDGMLRASLSGEIIKVNVSANSYLTPNEVLFRIVDVNSISNVTFTLPFNQGSMFSIDDKAVVTYNALLHDETTMKDQLRTLNGTFAISDKKYLGDSGLWEFTLPFRYSGKIDIAEPMKIRVARVTSSFDMVVPLSCLFDIEENKAAVYLLNNRDSLFGEESYVRKVDVTITQSNGKMAAIESKQFIPGVSLVNSSTKALSHGAAVKVTEP